MCVCVCESKGAGERESDKLDLSGWPFWSWTKRHWDITGTGQDKPALEGFYKLIHFWFLHTLFYKFTYLFWFYLILICFCLSLYTVEEIRGSDIKFFGTAECLSHLVADRLSAKSVTVFGTSIKFMSRSANFAALSLGAESIVRVSRNKSRWPLIHYLHFCFLSG